MDRSSWIIEEISGDQYYYVKRKSPGKNDPIYAIGMKMIEMSKYKFDKIY
jgi:hypothetical protein